jgi:outer membrane protein assembly factor BamB
LLRRAKPSIFPDALPTPEALLTKLVPALFAIAASALLVFIWQTKLPAAQVPLRVPAARPTNLAASGPSPVAQGKLTTGEGTPAELPGAWPGFRGPARDGLAPEPVPLADSWGPGEPRALWSIQAGEGYAGAAILNGRVYLMDYDRTAGTDALRCLSLADGREIWRFSYPVAVKRNHGMSRTVPAVSNTHVIALGPMCHVSCLDAATGAFKWGLDLVREYAATVPPWYAGQCPLLDGDRVILAPAGTSLLLAVDCESGRVLWQTPNPRGWKMTHVSVTPMELAGRKTYVYCGHRGVAGIAADDGSLLWDTEAWKISIATVASPVALPGDRIFLAGGYKAGSMMLEITCRDGNWSAAPTLRLDQDTFGATQQTPVFHDGYLYGVRPSGELVCLDPAGKIRWTSGMNHRFGLGPFLIAAGKLLVLNDDGQLTMAAATPDAFRPLATAKVLAGHESWGPMALAGNRLIVRDLTTVTCLDLPTQ